MLQRMRRGAQTLGAKALAGVICFVLVVFGFGAINLFSVSEPAAAEVNGEEITQTDLSNAVTGAKQRLARQMGDKVTQEQLDLYVTPEGELRGLIDRQLLLQTAKRLRLTGSPQEFKKFMKSLPAFQNEEEEFDQEIYLRTLQSQGLSPRSFEALLSDDLRVQQLYALFADTSFFTDFERKDTASVRFERRDYAYLVVDPETFKESIEIDQMDAESYYQANLDEYVTEETYDFEVVQLRKEGMADDISISDEEVEELYATEIEAARANAPRDSSHILLKVNDDRSKEDAIRELQQVRTRVLAGESFEEFAKELSEGPSGVDGGKLGSATRETYVPEFSDALWSLAEVGDLSQPIETQFGMHLIRLDGIEVVFHPSLEKRREAIREERRTELELQRFEDAYEQLDQIAFEQSDSLQPLVDEFGLELEAHADIRRKQSEGLLGNRKLRSAALEDDVLRNGFNSRPVLIEPGHAVVARLNEINPSKQLPFEDVSEQIRTKLVEEEAVRRAEEAVLHAKSQLEQEDVDYGSVADELGVEWQNVEEGLRNARKPQREIVRAAFSTPAPKEGTRELAIETLQGGGQALLVVSRVVPGDYAATTEADRSGIGDQLAFQFEQLDYGGFIETLRDQAKVVSHLPDFDPDDPMFRVNRQFVNN